MLKPMVLEAVGQWEALFEGDMSGLSYRAGEATAAGIELLVLNKLGEVVGKYVVKPDGRINKVGGKAAGKSPAKIGDSFGKMGTLVENPKIKVDWSQYAEHGYARLTQRGMSKELVDSIVKNGKALEQSGGIKYAFVTREGVAIVTKAGKLVTAWSQNFFDDAMNEIVQSLFGE